MMTAGLILIKTIASRAAALGRTVTTTAPQAVVATMMTAGLILIKTIASRAAVLGRIGEIMATQTAALDKTADITEC